MKASWALVLASAIMLALCAVPASAQVNRTWVSGTGNDTGTCPITTPCASFQYALSVTNAGGEIDCLTPGDFGGSSHSLTIGQSVSIVCDGVSNGGALVTSGDAIYINGPNNAVVYLSGLDLEGAGAGQNGVYVTSGSTIYITHTTIRGFNFGVIANGPANAITRVVIKDSIIVNNPSAGVYSAGYSGGTSAVATVNAVIDGNGIGVGTDNTRGGTSAIALIRTLLTGSSLGLNLESGTSGEFVGPSNTVTGAINGSPTSVPFK
jgi:hypothetical protein